MVLHNPVPCEQESGISNSRCGAGCAGAAQIRGSISARINRKQAINVVGLTYHCVPMLLTGRVSRETRACLSPTEYGGRSNGTCTASGHAGRQTRVVGIIHKVIHSDIHRAIHRSGTALGSSVQLCSMSAVRPDLPGQRW